MVFNLGENVLPPKIIPDDRFDKGTQGGILMDMGAPFLYFLDERLLFI